MIHWWETKITKKLERERERERERKLETVRVCGCVYVHTHVRREKKKSSRATRIFGNDVKLTMIPHYFLRNGDQSNR